MRTVRERLHQEGFETRFSLDTVDPARGRLLVRGHGTSQVFITIEMDNSSGDDWLVASHKASLSLPMKATPEPPAAPLILARVISEPAADTMWAEGVSFVDARGHGHLRFPRLSVELAPRRTTTEPRSSGPQPSGHDGSSPPSAALTPAGLSVGLIALVSPPSLASPLRDIAELVPASLGTVHTAVSDLQRSGYASRTGTLLEPRRLLDAWTSAYLRSYSKWHATERYECRLSVAEIHDALAEPGRPAAWLGGEAAAEAMGLPLRATTVIVYVATVDRPAVRKTLRLRRSDSGNLTLAAPLWSRAVSRPPYAPAPVIRADLIASNDPRQIEMVEELEQRDPVLRRLIQRG
ncbi:MAG: type IV toxin-antitoxin system AbiEi family antitoxin [Phycicoccus sp.]